MDQLDDYRNGDYTEREKAVIRMAEIMTHRSDAVLDEETRVEMSRHFSESEIVELGLFFALVAGLQKFNKVFQIFYACEVQGDIQKTV